MKTVKTQYDFQENKKNFSETTFVNKQPGRWETRVNMRIIRLPKNDLGTYEKLLYTILSGFKNTQGIAFPSVSTLAESMSCSERQVYTALGNLENTGLVTRKKRYNKSGAVIGSVYEIHDFEFFIPLSKRTGNLEFGNNTSSSTSFAADVIASEVKLLENSEAFIPFPGKDVSEIDISAPISDPYEVHDENLHNMQSMNGAQVCAEQYAGGVFALSAGAFFAMPAVPAGGACSACRHNSCSINTKTEDKDKDKDKDKKQKTKITLPLGEDKAPSKLYLCKAVKQHQDEENSELSIPIKYTFETDKNEKTVRHRGSTKAENGTKAENTESTALAQHGTEKARENLPMAEDFPTLFCRGMGMGKRYDTGRGAKGELSQLDENEKTARHSDSVKAEDIESDIKRCVDANVSVIEDPVPELTLAIKLESQKTKKARGKNDARTTQETTQETARETISVPFEGDGSPSVLSDAEANSFTARKDIPSASSNSEVVTPVVHKTQETKVGKAVPAAKRQALAETKLLSAQEAPVAMQQTANYLLLSTGRTGLLEDEISALRTLNAAHFPSVVQKEIDVALERFKRLGRNSKKLTFRYIVDAMQYRKPTRSLTGKGSESPYTSPVGSLDMWESLDIRRSVVGKGAKSHHIKTGPVDPLDKWESPDMRRSVTGKSSESPYTSPVGSLDMWESLDIRRSVAGKGAKSHHIKTSPVG